MRISDWSSDVCSSDLLARCRCVRSTMERAMMHAQQMIRSHPVTKGRVSDALVRCIEECYACAQACTACADACLSERALDELRQCVRLRSEEHTSELQSLMRNSYAGFCLKTKTTT